VIAKNVADFLELDAKLFLSKANMLGHRVFQRIAPILAQSELDQAGEIIAGLHVPSSPRVHHFTLRSPKTSTVGDGNVSSANNPAGIDIVPGLISTK
jgi:hypothetical protein